MYVSRGVLALEDGLQALGRPLQQRNFKVFIISAKPTGHQLADLRTFGVLITENSADLLEPAVIDEFSIIDPAQATRLVQKLADMTPREWLAGSLRMPH